MCGVCSCVHMQMDMNACTGERSTPSVFLSFSLPYFLCKVSQRHLLLCKGKVIHTYSVQTRMLSYTYSDIHKVMYSFWIHCFLHCWFPSLEALINSHFMPLLPTFVSCVTCTDVVACTFNSSGGRGRRISRSSKSAWPTYESQKNYVETPSH